MKTRREIVRLVHFYHEFAQFAQILRGWRASKRIAINLLMLRKDFLTQSRKEKQWAAFVGFYSAEKAFAKSLLASLCPCVLALNPFFRFA